MPSFAPVCDIPAVDDDRVEQFVTDGLAEPAQVAHRVIGGDLAELGLDREDTAVGALHDEVDLVVAAVGAQVSDGGLGCLRIHAVPTA